MGPMIPDLFPTLIRGGQCPMAGLITPEFLLALLGTISALAALGAAATWMQARSVAG